MEDLGMGQVFKDVASVPRGLVLVTGPTGSGKSTTLAAMIDYINGTDTSHILTIEDPIEFVHETKKCLVNQREVHRDTLGFTEALRSALREDPDIILVGEIARPGNHPSGADRSRNRPPGVRHPAHHLSRQNHRPDLDVFPAEEKAMVRSMLSESLQAVISQTLLKKDRRRPGGRPRDHDRHAGYP